MTPAGMKKTTSAQATFPLQMRSRRSLATKASLNSFCSQTSSLVRMRLSDLDIEIDPGFVGFDLGAFGLSLLRDQGVQLFGVTVD